VAIGAFNRRGWPRAVSRPRPATGCAAPSARARTARRILRPRHHEVGLKTWKIARVSRRDGRSSVIRFDAGKLRASLVEALGDAGFICCGHVALVADGPGHGVVGYGGALGPVRPG